MVRIIEVARLALLLTAAGLCASVAWLAWSVNREVKPVLASISTEASSARAVTDSLNETLAAINRPCGGGKPCGALADLAKTMNTLRMTAGQVEIAANHEDKRIGILDAQEAQIARDTHVALTSLNGTIRGVQPVLDGATDEMRTLALATDKLDALLADPNLAAIAGNLNQVSVNLAGVTDNANKITKDAADEVHSLTHPPKKSFWRAVFAVVHAAEPPIF